MTESLPVFDLVIAGAAASGLALAAALKQALGEGIAVAVIDPAPLLRDASPGRTLPAPSRFAEGPRRLLEDRRRTGDAIEPKAQAIVKMTIMDGGAVTTPFRLPPSRASRGNRIRPACPHGVQRPTGRGALGAVPGARRR